MIEAADRDVALFTAREVVGTAVDAYCHKLGNMDPSKKWRVKHLDAVNDGSPRHREVSAEFWRLQVPDAASLRADPACWKCYLEQCIRFANRIVSWVQA